MENTETITVNIVNRDYPPYKGITGESAAELAKYFLDAGFQVNVIHVAASFLGKGNTAPVGNIFKIKNIYNGENRVLRLLANLLLGYFLIRKSKKIPCDATVVMTDPSLLNMWASLLLKRRQWILWAMDLYPEAFVAWNIISANSVIYKKIYQLTIKNTPQHIIALGPLQADYLRKRYKDNAIDFSYLPCGIYDTKEHIASDRPQWACDATKIHLGYLGNLGAPHSLEFLYAVAKHLDAQKFKLILSVYGYGSKVQALKQYVQDKAGVEIVPPVSRAHLGFIDIHLASLLPQCTHISVPSKTVSSVCAGSAFLYCGSADSDNWFMLRDAGWLIQHSDNVEESVINFFRDFDANILEQKKAAARELAKKLNAGKVSIFNELARSMQMKRGGQLFYYT